MDKNNSPSNLYSHPDKLIEEHISTVCEIVTEFFDKEIKNCQTLRDILTIIAFSHDIGKTTEYFQRYIKGDKSLKNKPETKHAHLGGIIGFHLTEKYLKNKGIESPIFLILAYIIPKRHHSNLKCFYEDIILEDEEIKILQKQIDSIDKKAFKKFFENLKIENKEILKFEFEEINLEEIKNKLFRLRRYIRNLSKEKEINYYILTVLLFSYLLDGDKLDVGIKDKSIVSKSISFDENLVQKFLEKKRFEETKINLLRTQALYEVLNNKIDLSKKIYSLTLPTGMGKTLISLAFALKLANKIKNEKGIFPKIIYSLPFLSIIEQNFDVFKSVLEENGIKPDSFTILKHHHLSDYKYKSGEEEFDYDGSRILVEGWHSQIVITTFVQLFHTLIGYKNKTLRKFHHFTNSIVILDEVQSIPFKYWKVVREIILKLAKKYNFYVIFSTATQPLIFENKETFPLISHENYFSRFNRYQIKTNLEKQTLEEFFNNLKINNEKSYLFIFNTVKQAKNFYQKLKEFNPVYLTTHIVPKERLKRIKQLKNKSSKIAISTQIVEAGVDIDFDIIYRDLAPFDSVVQSAGRCNREGKKQKGTVNIINLFNPEHNRFFWSYIYDKYLINATKEILTEKTVFDELEVLELINKYFIEIKSIKSERISEELLEKVYSLCFSKEKDKEEKINSIADFKLIEEQPFKTDVFVQLDEDAVKVWESFIKIMEIKDIFERKKAFNEIKKDFYDYIISVPIKDNTPPEYNGFYYIPIENLDDYYDLETGYKTKMLYFEY